MGEALQLGGQPAAGVLHARRDVLGGQARALGEDLHLVPAAAPVDADQPLAVDPHVRAVGDPPEHLGTDVVEQQHAGPGQQLGPEVGVAAGDERRRVDHGHDARVHQLLGVRAVEVEVVDDRDVTRPQAPDQPAGAAVDACGAGDSGQAVDGLLAGGELHGVAMLSRKSRSFRDIRGGVGHSRGTCLRPVPEAVFGPAAASFRGPCRAPGAAASCPACRVGRRRSGGVRAGRRRAAAR